MVCGLAIPFYKVVAMILIKQILPPRFYDTLDRAGIATIKHIISMSALDIKKYTTLNIEDIMLIKNIVFNEVCPNIETCNILKKQSHHIKTRISTGCKSLDDILKGGLRKGTITEIFGESGCGKTQLALQIALNNWTNGSVFICTEDTFPTKRFQELKHSLPSFNSSIDYGKNIFIEHVTESQDFLSCISVRIPKLLMHHKLSLVFIDSIAAPYRCESTNYIKRAEELREIAMLLTSIAQKYDIAVLCINQVTSFDDSKNLLPSLGLAWSNMVSTRLMILKTNKTIDSSWQICGKCPPKCYIRELCVVFAPDLLNTRAEFVISSSGIETLPPK